MKTIKGIILAGGYGSRLFPLTLGTSKQLLPVYDKPMIYYPLSTLMLANITEILIISTPQDLPKFKKLLGDGTKLGLKISYAIQEKPNGIAESFIIGADFIGADNVCLILGDNIFSGKSMNGLLDIARSNMKKNICSIFIKEVSNPKDFGVVECDNYNKIVRINEKPLKPKSNKVVSGLYYYTNDVINISKGIIPSTRNELEITDINNYYISKNKIKLINLDKISWIDTGTYDSLLRASNYFQQIEENSGKKEACIEQIAYEMNYIDEKQFTQIANSMKNSNYGKYLFKCIENEAC